jgi:predicted dienelactone hydrolase
MRRLLPVLLLLLPAGLPAQQAPTTRIGGRDVAYWKPAGAAKGGYPVIVFSHGFGGCGTQSTFLMEALARAGYLVLAPNHADARCGGAARRGTGARPEEPFRDAAKWTDATYKERGEDVRAVLDEVLRSGFQGLSLDAGRVGLAGHSLGGYTVLGLAGAWPAWKDARVKAVLALSPFCTPLLGKGDLAAMKVPVMYQGGTRDFGITPSVKRPGGAYDRSAAPKFLVELDAAGHFAWTNLAPEHHATIESFSVAFFNRYVKGMLPDPLAPLTREPPPTGVTLLKVERK